AFDDEVTRVFDDMLQRSIPQYETMRGLVFEIGKRFLQTGTDVVDLGCSRGEALAPFVETFGSAARYVGVEVSPTMLEACRRRFEPEIGEALVQVLELELRDDSPDVHASVALSVLTLQFTPLEDRLRIVKDVHHRLVDGGAFILVEKVLGGSARVDRLLTE